MGTRLPATFLVGVLLVSACGSSAPTATPASASPTTSATQAPATSAGPTASAGPTTSAGPLPSDLPTSPPTSGQPASSPPPEEGLEPLPEPELTTAEDVGLFLYDPAYAEVAVVSMLNQLGIGIYEPDGTVIRAGAETSGSDLYLFEPEVRALIEMLLDTDSEDGWIDFRDFHAALAGLGFEGSAEDLAQAYAESYAAEPDAPISQFVGFVDVDAPISRFAAWLLIVDGFVPESGAGLAFASTDAGFVPVVAAGPSRRVARNRVQALSRRQLAVDPGVLAHLMLVVSSAGMRVWAEPTSAHEGHGGPGPTVSFTAWVVPRASNFTSPITGQSIIPVTTSPAGMAINWIADDVFYEHGQMQTGSEFTLNASGEARLAWQARSEPANGEGYVVQEVGMMTATVEGSDIITTLYGRPDLGALVRTEVSAKTPLEISWHEPEAMVVTLKGHYDVTIDVGLGETLGVGDDEFSGVLAKQEDGTWQGMVVGTAIGQQDSQFLGQPCTARWNATQKLLVVAGDDPGAQLGDFTFTFFPVTEPTGSTGRGRCPPTRWRQDGVSYAPYNDYNIHQAASGLGITVVLPQRPGGHVRVPVLDVPSAGITVHDSYWDIDIQFLGP